MDAVTIIAADANAHSLYWDNLVEENKLGKQLAECMEDEELVTLNDYSRTRTCPSTGNRSAGDVTTRKALFTTRKANWTLFEEQTDRFLSETKPDSGKLNSKCESLQKSLLEAAKNAIPFKRSGTTSKRFTPSCKQAIQRRNRAFREFQREPKNPKN